MKRKTVRLKRAEIVNGISEAELFESSTMDAIYVIRKLMALVEYLGDGYIWVDDTNDCGQVYSKKFDIWFNDDEWEEV